MLSNTPMHRCRNCNTELSRTGRFCPACGARITPAEVDEIETIAMPAVEPAPSSGRSAAAIAVQQQRFAPGTLIASRYRIISRLGKGGMGEVFRADDLILGQPVALKFLPESARSNVNLLGRFYDEVRIARQIAHRNVCRVYDIGELEGQPYLSMEYIDGEDMASLLRRIGRLPSDKALEFARKLCAGLAAAHAQGVLHRDLKPANVMIDGRGEVRIMDFGLAAVAEDLHGAEIRNGTPAYMAPEQLTGREVSVQSDIYSLGLVLYEIFTGKPPFRADSIAEMVRLREQSQITNPSTIVPELDKTAERAIMRCLDADPKNRPVSALALAAMLPGGDPLAEALAAGETPSPDMVANAGSDEGLHLKIAIPVLAAFVLMLAAYCWMYPKTQLLNRLPLEDPPEVLAAKARDLVRSLGYTERPTDTATGFMTDAAMIEFLQSKKRTSEESSRVLASTPTPIYFWYRQSPTDLAARDIRSYGVTTIDDPLQTVSGMITVALDVDGSLRFFRVTPPQFEERSGDGQLSAPLDWKPLFAAAHLDPEQFKPAEPEWTPLGATDARLAWTGTYPGRPDLPARVEAASFHGRPVWFELYWPWSKPQRAPQDSGGMTKAQISNLIEQILTVLFGIAACFIARYNWKAGRGDSRGAVRTGAYIALFNLLTWILGAHHVSTQAEQALLGKAAADAVFDGVVYWIVYLALEPWVRRYWPQILISWSRLLAGRWRDPMIGRDLLVALLLGLLYGLLIAGLRLTIIHLGLPHIQGHDLSNLMGTRSVLWNLVLRMYSSPTDALELFLFLFVFRAVLRKQWLAASAFILIFSGIGVYGDFLQFWYLLAPFYVAIYGILVAIMLRFGLLATVLAMFVLRLANGCYLTTDLSAWYGESSFMVVIVLLAMAAWGFKLSVSGRSGTKPRLANAS